jgi:cephalosporin hydroxylase
LQSNNPEFDAERDANIAGLAEDRDLQSLSRLWARLTAPHKYTYNFSWLGRPIIQFPQDVLAMQELIWEIQPEIIIETGIAHGGSLVFSASMLELNAACGGPRDATVVGIDIDIRKHNREAIDAHPMARRITMLQGSSIDPAVVAQVRALAAGKQRVLVCLDSDHTHAHVLAELEAYAPLTSVGSYCVVFDTGIEDLPPHMVRDRHWGPGNNPRTAITEYLRTHNNFEIDKRIDSKLLITVATDGYLRRVS